MSIEGSHSGGNEKNSCLLYTSTFGDFAADLEEPDVKDMLDALVFTHGVSNQSTMNHTPDYDNMVKRGYRWYIDQCKDCLLYTSS